jgi:hypothetical protein
VKRRGVPTPIGALSALCHLNCRGPKLTPFYTQGRREDARRLLEPVFTWFVEDLDTADLNAAERLLTTLR